MDRDVFSIHLCANIKYADILFVMYTCTHLLLQRWPVDVMCTMPHTTSAELPASFYNDAEASNTSKPLDRPTTSHDVVTAEFIVKRDRVNGADGAHHSLPKIASATDVFEDEFAPPEAWSDVTAGQCDTCSLKPEVDGANVERNQLRTGYSCTLHSILVSSHNGDSSASKSNLSDSGIASDCTDDDLGCRTEPTTPTTDDEPESGGSRKRRASYRRRVSFADDRQGGHLEHVIVFDPSSSATTAADEPEEDLYTCFTYPDDDSYGGGVAFSFDNPYVGFHSLTAAGSPTRRLEPQFPPPWSNPTALLARFQRDSVALETLDVVYASSVPSSVDRQLQPNAAVINGTVVVANLAFEKRVFARCTFDGWRSCVDVGATYAGRVPICLPSTSDGHLHVTDADKFAFSIDVPSPADQSGNSHDDSSPVDDDVGGLRHGSDPSAAAAAVEFAVCYEARCADGWRSMWDNNGCVNYSLDYVYSSCSDVIW